MVILSLEHTRHGGPLRAAAAILTSCVNGQIDALHGLVAANVTNPRVTPSTQPGYPLITGVLAGAVTQLIYATGEIDLPSRHYEGFKQIVREAVTGNAVLRSLIDELGLELVFADDWSLSPPVHAAYLAPKP